MRFITGVAVFNSHITNILRAEIINSTDLFLRRLLPIYQFTNFLFYIFINLRSYPWPMAATTNKYPPNFRMSKIIHKD